MCTVRWAGWIMMYMHRQFYLLHCFTYPWPVDWATCQPKEPLNWIQRRQWSKFGALKITVASKGTFLHMIIGFQHVHLFPAIAHPPIYTHSSIHSDHVNIDSHARSDSSNERQEAQHLMAYQNAIIFQVLLIPCTTVYLLSGSQIPGYNLVLNPRWIWVSYFCPVTLFRSGRRPSLEKWPWEFLSARYTAHVTPDAHMLSSLK